MIPALDETHNPNLTSWVDSANEPTSDFPIQNLPFGIFTRTKGEPLTRGGVALGTKIIDVTMLHERGYFDGDAALAAAECSATSLNGLMNLGSAPRTALRKRLSALFRAENPDMPGGKTEVEECLWPISSTLMRLPATIGDYTDFYASIFHATNIGSIFRPDNPLLPNYKHVPIGYHGRSSSIVPSSTAILRPHGQTKSPTADVPEFGQTKMLDYELEVGCFVGRGSALGETIPIDQCEEHMFGVCLVNDWSARDIQAWEYQPLGPFLAKNFATTLSPWVVTMEAIAPFRAPEFFRDEADPQPLPYLHGAENSRQGGIDLTLEVHIISKKMRSEYIRPFLLSKGNFHDLYWTFAQMLAHHTSNGCAMRPGDLIASGTVSGNTKESRGCMMELTSRGKEPITLPSGETRSFLVDGDEVIIRGYCDRKGFRRIGFGECRGIVMPSF